MYEFMKGLTFEIPRRLDKATERFCLFGGMNIFFVRDIQDLASPESPFRMELTSSSKPEADPLSHHDPS